VPAVLFTRTGPAHRRCGCVGVQRVWCAQHGAVVGRRARHRRLLGMLDRERVARCRAKPRSRPSTSLLNFMTPSRRSAGDQRRGVVELFFCHRTRSRSDPSSGSRGHGEVRLRELVFKESLRMRFSRVNLGEVRDVECLDLLLALNAGLPDGMASFPTAVVRPWRRCARSRCSPAMEGLSAFASRPGLHAARHGCSRSFASRPGTVGDG
jgi:hypothetical protein